MFGKCIKKNECEKAARMIESGLGNDHDEHQLYINEALLKARMGLAGLESDFYEKMVQARLAARFFGIVNQADRLIPQWGKNVTNAKEMVQLLRKAGAKSELPLEIEDHWSFQIPEDILQSNEIEKHLQTIENICIAHRDNWRSRITKI